MHDQNSAKVDITTYDKNMTARNASFLLEGTFAEGSRQSAVPRLFITGDFNGDGKMELVAVSGNKLPKGETRTWSRTTMFNLEVRYMIKLHSYLIILKMRFLLSTITGTGERTFAS